MRKAKNFPIEDALWVAFTKKRSALLSINMKGGQQVKDPKHYIPISKNPEYKN